MHLKASTGGRVTCKEDRIGQVVLDLDLMCFTPFESNVDGMNIVHVHKDFDAALRIFLFDEECFDGYFKI